MLEFLSKYNGTVLCDGKEVDKSNINDLINNCTKSIILHLTPKNLDIIPGKNAEETQYIVSVRAWMTKKSTQAFNFMSTWNNDIPMPLHTMQGIIIKETRGMYRMRLRGIPQNTCECLKCGRLLRNPVSRLYGIGPECMETLGIPREYSNEVAKDKIQFIERSIRNTTWEGWIAKSAIIDIKELRTH